MRTLLPIVLPVESRNKAIKDEALSQVLGKAFSCIKPAGRAIALLIMMNFTGLAPAFAQAPAAKGAPAVRNLLENDTVKAYLVTFLPGDALPNMDRPMRVLHYRSSGTLQREYPDGKVERRMVEEGGTVWVEAGSFGVKNVGGTTVVVFVVEVK